MHSSLVTVQTALDLLLEQRSSLDMDKDTDSAQISAAYDALKALDTALARAQAELSFYARNVADLTHEWDEVADRATNYLLDDAGKGAEQALAALGLECLPVPPEVLAKEQGQG